MGPVLVPRILIQAVVLLLGRVVRIILALAAIVAFGSIVAAVPLARIVVMIVRIVLLKRRLISPSKVVLPLVLARVEIGPGLRGGIVVRSRGGLA